MVKPTNQLYSALQLAYDHFNEELFESELPEVLFTNQRQNGVLGYFAPNRWGATENGSKCHEIAINPAYVGRTTLIQLMQTMVHEMVHCWQQCFGKPSIRTYHNKQWSDKMISLGLMPSSTGQPGGAVVGQRMSDYPLAKGKFIYSCERLLRDKKFRLPWVDRFANVQNDLGKINDLTMLGTLNDIDTDIAEQLIVKLEDILGTDVFAPPKPEAVKKVKLKYTCPECKLNVWGKPSLQLRCDDCNLALIES